MKAWLAIVLACLLLWACNEQPTQAVVTLDIEEDLRARVFSLSVDSLDARLRPAGASAEYVVRGPKAQSLPFSFGAVAREDDFLRLRIIGYDESHNTVIVQHVNLPLAVRRATQIPVLLHPDCARELCEAGGACELTTEQDGVYSCSLGMTRESVEVCESDAGGCACEGGACQEEAGTDLPEDEDATVDASEPIDAGLRVEDAGADRTTPAIDDGAVDSGGVDSAVIDGAPQGDAGSAASCGIEPESNPKICTNCGMGVKYCPFQDCVQGPCELAISGDWHGGGERHLDGHRFYGQQLIAADSGRVVGLGIGAIGGGSHGNPLFMLGLYENRVDDTPGELIVATPPVRVNDLHKENTPLLSEYDGVEYPVKSSRYVSEGHKYWLFVIANDQLSLSAKTFTRTWKRKTQVDAFETLKGKMPANLQQLSDELPAAPVGDLYVITTPAPE